MFYAIPRYPLPATRFSLLSAPSPYSLLSALLLPTPRPPSSQGRQALQEAGERGVKPRETFG